MAVLLRAALYYLEKWGMNPVFTNIYKKPLVESWTPIYMASLTRDDVVRMYEEAKRRGRPAGIALLPSPRSRIVVLDLDQLDRFGIDVVEAARRLSRQFVVAATPRSGLRIVFRVPEGGFMPHRIVIDRFGDRLGEGGGTFKHMWTFPPAVACLDEECRVKKRYVFVTSRGFTTLPWEVGVPPVVDWEEAKAVVEAEFQCVIEAPVETGGGGIRLASGVAPMVPPACWETLDEFLEWLETDGYPPLPACVARGLGYRLEGDILVEEGPVPEGQRFTFGAAAVLFLAAAVARVKAEDIVALVGRNLENFPRDAGTPLDTKLSQLLVPLGDTVVPRYPGLGSLGINIPASMCSECPYGDRCRGGELGTGGRLLAPLDKRSIFIPFLLDCLRARRLFF